MVYLLLSSAAEIQKPMKDDDFHIPDFCRLTDEQRKAAWERNPPKTQSAASWRSPEQEALVKQRQQALSDRKRLQKCISKQRRVNRQLALEAKLNDRSHIAQGHTWDARNARWIDPIEAALATKGDKPMPTAVKKVKAKQTKETPASPFGFRPKTNYDRMMQFLLTNVGQLVPVEKLAKEAYDTNTDLPKHCKRVVTMARKVQEKVIEKKRLPYIIKREKKENAVCIGLFAK